MAWMYCPAVHAEEEAGPQARTQLRLTPTAFTQYEHGTVAERAGHTVRAVWNKSFVESVVSYQTGQDNKFVTRKNCRSGLLS